MKNKKNLLRGQVVLEYILVLAVIVGIALVAYTAIKNAMKPRLATFKKKIEDDSASAGKPLNSYYNKVEFKKQ